MSDIKVKDGVKTANPGGTLSWTQGKLIVPDGTVVKAIEPRITFVVLATAADAGGMDLDAQEAALNAVELTLRTDLTTKSPATPINKQTITDLRLDANAILERDIVGGPGEATSIDGAKGLGGALVVGENKLVVVLPISLGHVASIKESKQLFGAGRKQLLGSELSFKFDRDVLAALDSNVKIVGYEVDLRVVPQRTNSDGEPLSPIPHIQTVKGGESDSVKTQDGLILTGNDTDEPLATTDITNPIDVKQGGQIVTEDALPADIQARFVGEPDSNTLEVGVATAWTPLLRTAEGPLKNTRPGAVEVTMSEHDKDLVTRWGLLPLLSCAQVMQRIKAHADMQDDGQTVHFVNAAAVEAVDAGDEHLPFTGMRAFTSDNMRFHNMAGVRCKKGGEPYLYVPGPMLLAISQEYGFASRDMRGDPRASALAVLVKWAREIPGAYDASEGAPPNGAVTEVFDTFKRMVTDFSVDLAASQAGKPEPTDARRQALADARRDPNELYALATR
jgi:hypothetical protein